MELSTNKNYNNCFFDAIVKMEVIFIETVIIQSNRKFFNQFSGMEATYIGLKYRQSGWKPFFICEIDGNQYNFYESELIFPEKKCVIEEKNKKTIEEELDETIHNIISVTEEFIQTRSAEDIENSLKTLMVVREENKNKSGIEMLDYAISMMRVGIKLKSA